MRSIHRLPANAKELPTATSSTVVSGRSLEKVSGLVASTKKSLLLAETNKVKRINSSQKKIFLDLHNNNKYRSQGADLSGVTQAKEGTSTRTSGERTRQPLPCQGRKELLNMVQEAMQGPHQLTTVPSSQRKRVPAPIGKMDREFIFLSPMPVHSNGVAVSGSAPFKSKGIQYSLKYLILDFCIFIQINSHRDKHALIHCVGITFLLLYLLKTLLLIFCQDSPKTKGLAFLLNVLSLTEHSSSRNVIIAAANSCSYM